MLNINEIVPWGRNLEEYCCIFNLSAGDLSKSILCFADGTGSFNFEMYQQGRKAISLDPVYSQETEVLEEKFNEALEYSYVYVSQLPGNEQKIFLETEQIREKATNLFLADFETGKQEGRYVPYEFPHRTPFASQSFELGLCAHFLFLYDRLGADFHYASVSEMLRVCKEVRIFPLTNQMGEESEMVLHITKRWEQTHNVERVDVAYGFHSLGHQMLRITPIAETGYLRG